MGEQRLIRQQIHEMRPDFAIEGDLDFITSPSAGVPTAKELAHAGLSIVSRAVLTTI